MFQTFHEMYNSSLQFLMPTETLLAHVHTQTYMYALDHLHINTYILTLTHMPYCMLQNKLQKNFPRA